jgi:hypothetical protein
VADSGEPGVALAGANAVAVVSQARRHRREAPAEIDEGFIALDPAVNDSALCVDDIVIDDRGFRVDHGALQYARRVRT